MINRDGSPSAITGAVVPPRWEAALRNITEPLVGLNPKWPFDLRVNHYPGTKPTNPGGTDSSSFAMMGIPTFRFSTETDYSYGRAWHTLYDTYSELVPYTEHQQHSALATAVVAYGIANLDEALPREGTYLPDGLFADIMTTSGTRAIVSLDYENAPLQVANFIRLVEGPNGPPQGGRRGSMGPAPGRIEAVAGGRIDAVIDSEVSRSVTVASLPLTENRGVAVDESGLFGLSGPNSFFITTAGGSAPRGDFTALGRVIAGSHVLGDFAAGDGIRSIRILRSGEAARAFRTDDDAFNGLLRGR
jgi:cyclophilin family peptidyl-prolyl cis-trans isomerase